ncbi:hypothetical protein [Neobacillus drentensis]|uniref:hypothetical protein n=1 Tax=Neobacillus drentensis TaxID=220684 RepID=UPI002866A6BC|nr:hypothetical protein [Neobacillus drentensis]MDR7240784.1 hypothetical protein [Neobacillus drentensis]
MNKLTKGALAMVFAGSVTFSVTNALLADQPLKRLAKQIALPISADRKHADVVNHAEKKVKVQTPVANVNDHDNEAGQISLKNSDTAIAAIQTNREKSSNRTITSLSYRNETTTPTSVATTVSVKSTKAPTTMSTPKTPVAPSKPSTTTTSGTKKPVTAAKPVTTTKVPTATNPGTSTKAPTAAKPGTNSKAPTASKPGTSTKTPATTTTPTKSRSKTKTSTTAKSNPSSTTTTKTNRGQQVSQAAKEKAASRKENKKETNVNKM